MQLKLEEELEGEETLILSKCLYAMIFLGVGEAISGKIMGSVIDNWNSRNACFLNIITLLIMIAFTI